MWEGGLSDMWALIITTVYTTTVRNGTLGFFMTGYTSGGQG